MFSHIMIGSNDIDRSKRFYDAVFAATGGQNRSFWTLIANKNILQGGAGKQFNAENIKYVPKFFAAAIVGENPQDFGVTLQPLSSYTK